MFVLSLYIILLLHFIIIPWKPIIFQWETERGRSGREGRESRAERGRKKEYHNQDILSEKKVYFQLKENNTRNYEGIASGRGFMPLWTKGGARTLNKWAGVKGVLRGPQGEPSSNTESVYSLISSLAWFSELWGINILLPTSLWAPAIFVITVPKHQKSCYSRQWIHFHPPRNIMSQWQWMIQQVCHYKLVKTPPERLFSCLEGALFLALS